MMFWQKKETRWLPLRKYLDEVFVLHFLMAENNSYKDFPMVIKNRYPNLRGCSLQLSGCQEEGGSVAKWLGYRT